MARLNVSATIHPKSVRWVMVSVEDADGDPLKYLKVENFSVWIWASSSSYFPPGGGATGVGVPVLAAKDVTAGAPHSFWQLQLGNLTFPGEGGPDLVVPVATTQPLVYLVAVNFKQDYGQALACACCTPGTSPYEHLREVP